MDSGAKITPSTIAAASSTNLRSVLQTSSVCLAAARAILRHDLHLSDHKEVKTADGLHPMYISLHGRVAKSGVELKEVMEVLSDVQGDVFDAVTALDRLDGGISVLLHCPGHQALAQTVEDVTMDLVVSPRELSVGGKDLSRALSSAVQSFAAEVALPYLARFSQRCTSEGILPPPADSREGKPARIDGNLCLLSPELPEGLHIQCQYCPPRQQELLQNITSMNLLAPRLSPRPLPAVEEEDRQASGVPPYVSLRQGIKAFPASGRKSNVADDSYSGAIISIGPRTDAVLDRFALTAQEIPKLHLLTRTERSSKWEEIMRGDDFSYSYEIASTLSEAMHADFGTTVGKAETNSTARPSGRFGMAYFFLAFCAGVIAIFFLV